MNQNDDPHRSRVQSEIEAFLSGGKPPQPPQSTPAPPQRPRRQPRSQTQPAPQQRRPPAPRPQPAVPPAAQPPRSQATASTVGQRRLSSGVSEHVNQYINQHVNQHLSHDVDEHVQVQIVDGVRSHIGTDSNTGNQPALAGTELTRSVLRTLRSSDGIRQAILINEILTRPDFSRLRRR